MQGTYYHPPTESAESKASGPKQSYDWPEVLSPLEPTATYLKTISFPELYKAARQCTKNIRWKGSTKDYEINILDRTVKLCRELASDSYRISSLMSFYIYEPKLRKIYSLLLRDRVVQRSLCNNGVYKWLTKDFIADNCACLNERGPMYAKDRLRKQLYKYWRKYGTKGWVLKLDVKSYFQSIPHSVAKAAVRKRIPDPMMADMVCTVIDTFPDDRPQCEIDKDPFGVRGLALGSQLSQLIAIAVLSPIDHQIKERSGVPIYIRYMDDIICIAPKRSVVECIKKTVANTLKKLGMSLNKKSRIFPLKHGFTFLQFRFKIKRTGFILLRYAKNRIRRMKRRLVALHKECLDGTLSLSLTGQKIYSWCEYVSYGHTERVIQKILEYGAAVFKDIGDLRSVIKYKPEAKKAS